MSPAPRVTTTSPALQGTIQGRTDFVDRVGPLDRGPQAGGPAGQVGGSNFARLSPPLREPERSRPRQLYQHFADLRPVRPADVRCARPDVAERRTTPGGRDTSGAPWPKRPQSRLAGVHNRRSRARRRPSATVSSRRRRPPNAANPRRIACHETPTWYAAAIAARALTTLCSPGTASDTRPSIRPRYCARKLVAAGHHADSTSACQSAPARLPRPNVSHAQRASRATRRTRGQSALESKRPSWGSAATRRANAPSNCAHER